MAKAREASRMFHELARRSPELLNVRHVSAAVKVCMCVCVCVYVCVCMCVGGGAVAARS